jgi:hypothetical protein
VPNFTSLLGPSGLSCVRPELTAPLGPRDLVDRGVPPIAAVVVLAVLTDAAVLHPAGSALAARPDMPSLSTPGFVWERWHTPRGGSIEIVGERPRPHTARHRGSVGVIWQCSQCRAVEPDRIRLGNTRTKAVQYLTLHLRDLDAPSSSSSSSDVRAALADGAGAPSLPPGWAPHGAAPETGALLSGAAW